jgi:hypothetical protein
VALDVPDRAGVIAVLAGLLIEAARPVLASEAPDDPA